jgi:acyl-CoA synthetase (NDP forming)
MHEAAPGPPPGTGLERLFRPRSIALLGGSRNPAKFGGRPLVSLRRLGFEGELIWVGEPGPDGDDVRVVPSVQELPAGVDLAVLLAPAVAATELAAACVERQVGALLAMSGGFAESGEEGSRLQRQLGELGRAAGIRVLGPNCPGYVNVHDRVAASASGFATRQEVFPGPLSLISQSGAVAGILAAGALSAGIGLGAVVCTGNQIDVALGEVAGWLSHDSRNRVLGIFVEGLGEDASLFEQLEAARRAGMPIVALRAGVSSLSREVLASHTGGVAGEDSTWSAICADLGIVQARGYDELIELAGVLALRRPSGRRLAVVGASGGMGAVLADAVAANGLELPAFGAATESAIRELTPSFGRVANPLDVSSSVLTEPERLGRLAEIVAADPAVDSVAVAVADHPPELSLRIAAVVAAAAPRCEVPVVLQWSAGELSRPGRVAAARAGVPVLPEPRRFGWAMAQVDRALAAPRRREASGPPLPLPPDGEPSEHELKALLAAAGLRAPRSRLLGDPAEAAAAVEELGGIAVVKADVAGLVHKLELGAVRLDVGTAAAVAAATAVRERAIAALGAGRVRGILVEERVEPLAELLVSVRSDPVAGAVLTVAAGGSWAELLGDAATRVAPVDAATARELLLGLRLAPLLLGARGRPAADLEALALAIATVSRLGTEWGPRLGLLELNPIAALPDGALVLDAGLRSPAGHADGGPA